MGTVVAVGLAVLSAVPATLTHLGWLSLPIELATLCDGVAIIGASFAVAWAAEAAEHDIPRAVAITAVALLAVLPEYAVDIVFAVKAGQDPAYAPYAAANMTGSNRLLLGLGWPTVSVLAWLAHGRRLIRLDRAASLPMLFLAGATVYSFSLPLRAIISPIDSLVLIGLFAIYAGLAWREETVVPELVGPAAVIGSLPTSARRLTVVCLFAFAGAAIATSAEPFAQGLVRTGQSLGIDEFLLVQWVAPLASEAPEFLVAALLALRGKAAAALALLLSAKLNQWTLLVGSLPLAYSIGAGTPSALPLDARQGAEVLLTAAQGLFGVAILASLSYSLGAALLLGALFIAQFITGGLLRTSLHNPAGGEVELLAFSAIYVLLSLVALYRARGALGSVWRRERTRRRQGRRVTASR